VSDPELRARLDHIARDGCAIVPGVLDRTAERRDA